VAPEASGTYSEKDSQPTTACCDEDGLHGIMD
jgi:hypothetical protein